MPGIIVEICAETVEGAVLARQAGAHRIELCAGLVEGGTTPSAGSIELAVKRCGLPVHVMIRPRGGDFCYSKPELDVMRRDIDVARERGAAGVVLGILTDAGDVDRERTLELARAARPLSVTFHRAFDMARDPLEALDVLIELGIDRVLTSGQEATALEGRELIRRLIEQARGRLVILPGCGIDASNAREILRATGARELHASCRSPLASPMRHRNVRCSPGDGGDEFRRLATDLEKIRALVRAAGE